MEEIGTLENGEYKSPFWWKNYNSIKHRRDSDYAKANLENLIFSFGALALINLHRIIKTKDIKNPSDLYKHVKILSLYDLDNKYKIHFLQI